MSPLSLNEARVIRDLLHSQSKRLVFTNGCFDILHAGHVGYLTEARNFGDALIVGVNSDESIQKVKGPGRPLYPAAQRAAVLQALTAVDHVLVFHEPRVTRIIETLRPHVYVKGGDYTFETLDPSELAMLKMLGSQILFTQRIPSTSTSDTLTKLKHRPLRLGVLGSGTGSTVDGLLRAIDSKTLAASIDVIISDQPEAGILEIARTRQIHAEFVSPGDGKTRLDERAQLEIRDILKNAKVDLIILAGFMRRLKSAVLDAFPKRILNIHPSLLPRFPGMAAWTQALNAGSKRTGCTVHLATDTIDSGRILAQSTVPIYPSDTPKTLHRRIQESERVLYPKVIQQYGYRLIATEKDLH